MRLIRLKITNFRCFKEETTIDLDNIAVIIGKNDSGKSSIFDAIDIFMDEKGVPDTDDCCVYTQDSAVYIGCIFDNLPTEIVLDEQYSTNISKEYLLNSDGFLEIVKVYNCALKSKGKLSGVYARALHPTAEGYNDLLSLTNAKLKQRAVQLDVNLSSVNQTINPELRQAIWLHSSDLNCQETDVELKSEDTSKIWDQLKKHLPIIAIFRSDRPSTDQDAEAQDPMKAAIKEAIKTQQSTLDDIAEQVKKEVQEIADLTVKKIKEMSPELASQLKPQFKIKDWDTLFSVSLTGDEDISVNKRGSGTRRLVLLNFFRAKAEKEAVLKDTSVIYAVEEPETSQHPNHQKLLIKAFQELSEQQGCQIFLTTHTPMLARHMPKESLRFLTRDKNNNPVVLEGSDEQTLIEIRDSLGVLTDHNIRVFLGVEGRNDINFLCIISNILYKANEDVPDLQLEEEKGNLVFIPLGGSNMDLWISRLEDLKLPEFYLMDREYPPPEKPKYIEIAKDMEERGCTAWITKRKELENYIHPDVIKSEYSNYAGTGDDFEDVPFLFAQAVHEVSGSSIPWDEVVQDKEKLGKKTSQAKRRLNTEFVERMTPKLLTEIDTNNEIRSWLKEIGLSLRS
jgi:putative ATP-dependent endonuclease of OLD family